MQYQLEWESKVIIDAEWCLLKWTSIFDIIAVCVQNPQSVILDLFVPTVARQSDILKFRWDLWGFL